MLSISRPGAYLQRVDRARPGPVQVRTDIAGFVGIARQGPLDTPVPVQSFRQFQSHFGHFTGAGYLAYTVRAFFENGGRKCWVIRVASRRNDLGAGAASVDVGGPAGWSVQASSPGVWGNDLTVRVRRERRAETVIDVAASTADFVTVGSVAELGRASHVEIAQPGQPVRLAVVDHIDATARRLWWAPGADRRPLPYAAPPPLAPDLPAILTSVTYAVDIARNGRLEAHFEGLSRIPENPRYGPSIMGTAAYSRALRDRVPANPPPPAVIADLHSAQGQVPAPLGIIDTGFLPLTDGRDGLATLAPGDFTGGAFFARDDDAAASAKLRGIRALELVDEISIVAVPDIVIQPEPDPVYETELPPDPDPCLLCPPPPEPRRAARGVRRDQELPPVFSDDQVFHVQSALIAHCAERCDRFAVLDPPFSATQDNEVGLGAITAWRNRFDTDFAALYYPWLRSFEPRRTGTSRAIPPSGHVTGQYAFHDLKTGVHRAPANVRLVWLHDLLKHTAFGEQEFLNEHSVNVIRSEAARGLRVMGARTLSSDPDWRFVNVRRLMLMIKRAVELLSQWVVFEPNNAATRTKYAAALTNFLAVIWEAGALSGNSPQEAYFVKCDEENNPAADRIEGRLLAEIGFAPAYPLEFVLMRVGLQGNELTIEQSATLGRAA